MMYIALGSNLTMQGRKRTRQLTGFDPQTLHVPFDKAQQQQLWQTCLSWQVALADSVGILGKHAPAHKLLQFIPLTSFVGLRVTKATPIPGAPTYFTGRSNNGKGDIVGPDEQETPVTSHTSTQRVELVAVTRILVSKHKTPIDIVSDSAYVVGMTKSIETTKIKQVNSEELFLFLQLQKAIQSRSFPFFLSLLHIVELTLPSLGNYQADLLMMPIFKQVYQSHLQQSARSLRHQFNVTKSQATQIVQACPSRQ